MINVFVNNLKVLTDQDSPLFSVDKLSDTSTWVNGGAGINNGRLNLYNYQENRIRACIPVNHNHKYTISIANLTNQNFYFNYFLAKDATENSLASSSTDWIKDKNNVSLNSGEYNYLYIILGSDGIKFTGQAINTLVKCNVTYNATLKDMASKILALEKQIGGDSD